MENVERISRAIIVNEGKILLCKSIAKNSMGFLPGGHIENGESEEIALAREIQEEIGRKISAVKKVSEINNSYERDGIVVNEILYTFLAKLDSYKNIKSIEAHLKYEWIPLLELSAENFKPAKTIDSILKVVKENLDFFENKNLSV